MEALIDALLSVEPGDSAPHLKQPHWTWDKAPPSKAIVAYVMGTDGVRVPVACLRLFKRHITSPGAKGDGGCCFSCYGIGGVFTEKPWRGKGLASLLLDRAETFARERGAFLALFAVYGKDLYLRAGYIPVAKCLETREHLWVKSTDAGLGIRPGEWSLYPGGHF